MPVINTTTLQQLVAIKQIGWISLDTNIFIACGKDIKKSPVNDIQKISDKVGFVLSWITKEEVIKKYVEKNIDDASQLKNSYNRLRRILDSSTCTNLDSILTLDLSCHIRNAFDSFCKNTSCQIYYPENGIDIKEIFELYFNSIPPFEDSKNKKCEFPDAAMLVCLEQFAKEYDTNILLITCDKGCVDYAMDSESIFVLEELSNNGKALLLSAINALTFDKYNLFIEKFKECAQAEHNFYDNIKSCITELVTDTSNYGINLISANLLRTLSENINSNVIAKIVPLQQVGCFVQANRLINYYNSVSRGIIDKSVFPVFARIEDKSELLYNYIKIERYLLSITFSICVLMSLLSSQIIVILLGVQWKEASWMFELLVFSIMPVAIQILNRNILKSLGNTRQILNNELIKSGITLLFLFLGVIFSLSGVICGFVVSQVLSAIWIMRSIAKELEYSIYEQLKLVLSYVLPNLMVYFIIKIVIYYMPIEGMFGEAIMKIGLWFVVTFALSFIFRQYEWINMLKVLRRKMLYRK